METFLCNFWGSPIPELMQNEKLLPLPFISVPIKEVLLSLNTWHALQKEGNCKEVIIYCIGCLGLLWPSTWEYSSVPIVRISSFKCPTVLFQIYLSACQKCFKQGKHHLNGKGQHSCILLDSAALTVHFLIVCKNRRSLQSYSYVLFPR